MVSSYKIQIAVSFAYVAPIIFFLLLTLQIRNYNQSSATKNIMLMTIRQFDEDKPCIEATRKFNEPFL